MCDTWIPHAQAALVDLAASHLAATDLERIAHLHDAAGNLQKAIEALEDEQAALPAIYDGIQRGDDADL